MPFTAIDHPAIACSDSAAQIEWYCRVLGMRVIAADGKQPPAAIVGYGGGVGDGPVIELMPAREPGGSPAEMPRFSPGLRHLALRVSDFGAAHRQLLAAGVTFLGEPGTALGGGRIVSFRDPEGNELQIVER
ncbi:MAG TPA: VOC family protein [Tepidisphaeraceae bacterium]|nr:VOC family protein [Tepidisphaeraceae bacterium]